MPQKKTAKNQTAGLRTSILRSCRVTFAFVLIYAVYIIASDAWRLIPDAAVLQRWKMLAVVAAVNTIVWYVTREVAAKTAYYKLLVYAQVLLGIGLATFSIYTQRGMASRGIILYMIPLLYAAVLMSRTALFATAALCVTAYASAALRYFFTHFGEGYKVELYAEVSFYCAVIFVVAALLHVLINPKKAE